MDGRISLIGPWQAFTAMVLYVMRVKSAALFGRPGGPKASLRVLPPLAQRTANEAITPVSTLSIAFLPSSGGSNVVSRL
jgi:hypothetical protein